MDKNIIKQRLSEMQDARTTPGISVTSNALKKSAKENKKGVKDMDKNLADYEKNLTKGMQTTDVPNKFNYEGDSEVEYHNQMEIMNGQEMIQYDRDPDTRFKERAYDAIVGSSNMGNNPEWANVIPAQQGFTGPEFGKKLADNAKQSFKKRLDADKGIMSFGDDIEVVPKGSKPMGKHSALAENKNNEKPQIKEGMKRLKFKQPFNGFGNALKMIPESYKIDNKVFEMTDGNENYKIRWEGSLNEGKAVILMASDKTLVNEDMQRMKALMGYKSHETLGLVKGKARLDENKIFGDIWNKTKVLLETEDMDGADAKEGNWDDVTKKAPEATKHVEGSVKKDGAMAKAKEGNPDKAVKHAPEAKKPMKSSKGANVESEANPAEGNWDDVTKKAPEATKHVTMKEAYEMEEAEEMEEVKTEGKEANWDEVKVPHAAEAKKHIHMGKETKAKMETEAKEETVSEGVTINGIFFAPINESWMEEMIHEEEEEETNEEMVHKEEEEKMIHEEAEEEEEEYEGEEEDEE